MGTTSANLQAHENPLWELAKYIETSQNSVEKVCTWSNTVSRNDGLLMRNQVTAMINANKKEYYKHVDTLSKSDPKPMWGEIDKLMTNKPKHQQRLCILTPQSFNKCVVQIGRSQVDSRGRMNDNDTYWKGSKSKYTFRFKEITHVDVEQFCFPRFES